MRGEPLQEITLTLRTSTKPSQNQLFIELDFLVLFWCWVSYRNAINSRVMIIVFMARVLRLFCATRVTISTTKSFMSKYETSLAVYSTALYNTHTHTHTHTHTQYEYQEDSVHDSLAVAVANEVLSDTDTIDVRLYCRSLSTMELTPTNQVNVYLKFLQA